MEKEVKPLVEEFLQERGLELSKDKTSVVHIDDGFDFLGWNFRKYRGKMFIKPSKKQVNAVLKTIRDKVKVNQATKQESLIGQLNPIIQG